VMFKGNNELPLSSEVARPVGKHLFPVNAVRRLRRRFRRNSATLAQRRSRSVRLCDKNRPFVTSGQFDYLDPCRGIHAPPAEQTGQKCCHGELLSDRPTRPRRRAPISRLPPEISFRRRFDHQSTESPLACRRVLFLIIAAQHR
jgi:hypothetical protein